MDIFIFLLEPQIELMSDRKNNIYIHDTIENYIYRLYEPLNLKNTELIKDISFEDRNFQYLDRTGKCINVSFHNVPETSEIGPCLSKEKDELKSRIPSWSDSQKRKDLLLNMHHIQTVIIENDVTHLSNESVEYEIVLNHFLLKKELILNYIFYKNTLYFLNNLYQKGSFLFINFFPIIYVPFENIIGNKYPRSNVPIENHFYFDVFHFSYQNDKNIKDSVGWQPNGGQFSVNNLEFQQQNLRNGYEYFYPGQCTQESSQERKRGQMGCWSKKSCEQFSESTDHEVKQGARKLFPAKNGHRNNLVETLGSEAEKSNQIETLKNTYKSNGSTSKYNNNDYNSFFSTNMNMSSNLNLMSHGIYKQIKYQKSQAQTLERGEQPLATRQSTESADLNQKDLTHLDKVRRIERETLDDADLQKIEYKNGFTEAKILYQFDEARNTKMLNSKKKGNRNYSDAQKLKSKNVNPIYKNHTNIISPPEFFKESGSNNFGVHSTIPQNKSIVSTLLSSSAALEERVLVQIPKDSLNEMSVDDKISLPNAKVDHEIINNFICDANTNFKETVKVSREISNAPCALDETHLGFRLSSRQDTGKMMDDSDISKIVLITVGWNESNMLEMFLAYYAPQVDKIVYYDNESTDDTREFITYFFKNNGIGCEYEILTFQTDNEIRDDLLLDLKNQAWKRFKNSFEWVIIVDVDEFIIPPNRKSLREYIFENSKFGAIQCVGYQMFGTRYELPEIKKGARCEKYDKICIWNLKSIVNTNYSSGCHKCRPDFVSKEIQIQSRTCELRHMKFVGNYKYLCDRAVLYHERLSKVNKKNNWGTEYSLSNFKKNYLFFSRKTIDLVF